ncbi:MAG: signal recognition particle receptor subunit alpha, partial [Cyclobacteriaceae bacterium]|nr:signal recognition particle receptor subunit alpha [Cyclobacteriaceae bacterium]
MGIFGNIFTKKDKETLEQGLKKTKEGFFSRLGKAVVGKSTVDAEVLDNLEEVLVSSDVGINTTIKIIERIEDRVAKDKYLGIDELNRILKEEIAELLSSDTDTDLQGFELESSARPYVLMVVGVNG